MAVGDDLRTWAPTASAASGWIRLFITICAIVYFVGTMTAGQTELARSVDRLTVKVDLLGEEVHRGAVATEGLSEHLKQNDIRLERIEREYDGRPVK